MKLQGEHTFGAPREMVWKAVIDPQVLARTLPGCERLEATGEHTFEGALNIRVGPVSGKFQGTVKLSELQAPEGYLLDLNGQGAPGFVQGKGSVRLEEEGGGTVLRYDLDAQVGGRIAGVGQRLLDSSAKVITRQALEGLEAQITAIQQAGAPAAAAAAGEAATSPAPAPAAPSQARFAARFAKGLFDEMVPARYRPVVVGAGLVLLLVVAFLIVRACS